MNVIQFQLTDFVERLLKHARNGEIHLFKRPIEQKYSALLSYNETNNLDSICDFEFVYNYAAIQSGVKSTFGYVRSRHDSGQSAGSSSNGSSSNGGVAMSNGSVAMMSKQPPISRPVATSSSTASMSHHHHNNNSLGLSPILNSSHHHHHHHNSSSSNLNGSNFMSNGLVQGIASLAASGSNINGISLNAAKSLLDHRQTTPGAATGGGGGSGGYHLPSLDDSLLAKRFNRSLGPLSGNSSPLGDLNLNGATNAASSSNPYEKWSTGSDTKQHLFSNGSSGGGSTDPLTTAAAFAALSQAAVAAAATNGHNTDSILDLSSKLLASQQQQQQQQQHQQHQQQMVFPPKSQIKRQKMIYHCKFGEFGVLEGQFTEPSGVAVNAQNDIIVADTNNHRIQIFDKEGRFKFQFGECGKRDGQLLYPNRVAVVRNSGDIIVTERSPTHQVQIYNQYGQFVRKFGANILQHPRGVCVDNKGRIVVVECKVMRVIIFDQMGNVLNKFGCSKHLEFPNGVVVNDRQEIFISDNRAHCVKVFNYEGLYLRQIGGEGKRMRENICCCRRNNEHDPPPLLGWVHGVRKGRRSSFSRQAE